MTAKTIEKPEKKPQPDYYTPGGSGPRIGLRFSGFKEELPNPLPPPPGAEVDRWWTDENLNPAVRRSRLEEMLEYTDAKIRSSPRKIPDAVVSDTALKECIETGRWAGAVQTHAFASIPTGRRRIWTRDGALGFLAVIVLVVLKLVTGPDDPGPRQTLWQSLDPKPFSMEILVSDELAITPSVDAENAETEMVVATPDISLIPEWFELTPAQPVYHVGQSVVVVQADTMLDESNVATYRFTFVVDYCASYGGSDGVATVDLKVGSQPTSAAVVIPPSGRPVPIQLSNCIDQNLLEFRFNNGAPEEFPVQRWNTYLLDGSVSGPGMALDQRLVFANAADPTLFTVDKTLHDLVINASVSSGPCLDKSAIAMYGIIWEELRNALQDADNRITLEPYGALVPNVEVPPFTIGAADAAALHLNSGGQLNNFTLLSVECP